MISNQPTTPSLSTSPASFSLLSLLPTVISNRRALRSTPHAVLAFTVQGISTRILLNSFNHLPDAIETTRDFHDFWYFWAM